METCNEAKAICVIASLLFGNARLITPVVNAMTYQVVFNVILNVCLDVSKPNGMAPP